jgi:plasmid stabilization system protein ParE
MTRTDAQAKLTVGDRLPALSLPAAPDGRRVNLREQSRQSRVILILARGDERSRGYATALADAAESIRLWDSRLAVVIEDDVRAAHDLHDALGAQATVLADPERVGRALFDTGTGPTILVIADRYGQIYFVQVATHVETLPAPSEIEEWVKYLATQCPECGVIDDPGYGEWQLG